ncbi:hypothetical protein E2320_005049 [Naja naja]|nr:hypothetical protein E2320_005049 [Naja naja]
MLKTVQPAGTDSNETVTPGSIPTISADQIDLPNEIMVTVVPFPPATAKAMDITIQHPWFKRALGPLIPSRFFDHFFGDGFFEYDLLPLFSSSINPYYRQSFFRTLLDSGVSEVRSDRDKFLVFLDVKHFSPEDLSVKVIEDFVEIHGKHNERQVKEVDCASAPGKII